MGRTESCALGSTEMTWWVTELTIKPNDLSLSPRLHLVEAVLCPPGLSVSVTKLEQLAKAQQLATQP